MKCEVCELDMVIYRVEEKEDGTRETVHVCRNPKCPRFDKRLRKEQETKELCLDMPVMKLKIICLMQLIWHIN